MNTFLDALGVVGIIAFYCLCTIIGLGVPAVIIWAIIRLVVHFTS